ADPKQKDALIKELCEVVREWGCPPGSDDIIRSSTRIMPLNIFDLPNLNSFYKGRVCLLGDAAHGMPPHLGQGANMALEDGGILSELLNAFPNSYETAFKLYDKHRRPHAQKLAAGSRKMGVAQYPQSPLAVRVSEVVLNVGFKLMTLFHGHDNFFKYDFKVEAAKLIAKQKQEELAIAAARAVSVQK
ncbi:UNVERIFIED_CONTAM: hypothetical protein HDU68_000853, partial [Siphonaria sp. JEL0065]